MLLLLLALATSFATRLWADPAWYMLARALCGISFAGSLLAFTAALAHQARTAQEPGDGAAAAGKPPC